MHAIWIYDNLFFKFIPSCLERNDCNKKKCNICIILWAVFLEHICGFACENNKKKSLIVLFEIWKKCAEHFALKNNEMYDSLSVLWIKTVRVKAATRKAKKNEKWWNFWNTESFLTRRCASELYLDFTVELPYISCCSNTNRSSDFSTILAHILLLHNYNNISVTVGID